MCGCTVVEVPAGITDKNTSPATVCFAPHVLRFDGGTYILSNSILDLTCRFWKVVDPYLERLR